MFFKERFFYILIIASLVYAVYYLFHNNEEYVMDYTLRIEILEQKVDSLHSINGELTFKVDTLNQQISQLDNQIDLKDNRIQTLKYKVNEKVNAVDSFNGDELKRFFTERYKQYLDPTTKVDSTSSN